MFTSIALGGMLSLLPVCFAHAQTLQGVGVVPFGSAPEVTAISADGTTVVGSTYLDNPVLHQTGSRGFRWTAPSGTTMLGIGATSVSSNAANDGYFVRGVSGDGSMAVGLWVADPGSIHAVPIAATWQGTGPAQRLPPNDLNSLEAIAVSADGSTIVGHSYNLGPVKWQNGIRSTIELTNGSQAATVAAVNANGTIVAGSVRNQSFGYAQYGSTRTNILYGGYGPDMSVHAMNNDGSVIVGTSYYAEQFGPLVETPTMWLFGLDTEIEGILLPVLPGKDIGLGLAVSGDGRLIGGWNANFAEQGKTGFVFDRGTGTTLSAASYLANFGVSLSGWQLSEVRGFSSDGMTIAGNGIHEYAPGLFRTEGWVATIPAPGISALLVAVGCTGAVRRRRREKLL